MKARRQLREWLTERELDLSLGRADIAPAQAMRLRYDDAGRSATLLPADIVLLKPSAKWGPVYGLILDNRFVPFGRYAEPAVPGEWKTGLKATPLRVLCFWNARSMNDVEILDAAVKRVPEKKMRDFEAVYQHVVSGAEISAFQMKKLGPPLVHPADPRYEYLDEERKRIDDHVKKAAGKIVSFEEDSASWLMAAEGRPGYGK